VVTEFGLVGLNGIDFIARGGVACPIEVNPRYSASMELLERSPALSIFNLHAAACQGDLPLELSLPAQVEGKAIVFAKRDVTMGDTRRWLHRPFLADIPHPGEKVRRGRPICTVFASAHDAAACYRLLLRRASRVYLAAQSGKRAA
jgi:predicted ATP-grasp superfamily ATP-dependent carboligase